MVWKPKQKHAIYCFSNNLQINSFFDGTLANIWKQWIQINAFVVDLRAGRFEKPTFVEKNIARNTVIGSTTWNSVKEAHEENWQPRSFDLKSN